MMACKRCAYCTPETRAPQGDETAPVTTLYCRRVPPRPMLLPTGVVFSVFPTVHSAAWCGLFKLSFWKLLFGNGPRT